MTEILFRGKRIDNGEWVYGDVLNRINTLSKDKAIVVFDGYVIPKSVKVFNESIGQYTGLKDKNGKKIFEGDVVRVFQPFNVPTKAIVELSDGCFELNGIELTWRDYVKCFVANHAIEIIGNIHEGEVQE